MPGLKIETGNAIEYSLPGSAFHFIKSILLRQQQVTFFSAELRGSPLPSAKTTQTAEPSAEDAGPNKFLLRIRKLGTNEEEWRDS